VSGGAVRFSRQSNSEAETALIGSALGRLLRGGDVLLLDGALGAGKTTLVRTIAAGMGLDTAAVGSPTFVLVHHYERADASAERPSLFHIDAYRLRGAADLDTLGWDRVLDAVASGMAAAVIEWAERLGPAAPAGAARCRIEHVDETSRRLDFEVPDSWRVRDGWDALAARQPTVCPITGRPVPSDSPTYPFADDRARMADLHRWFSGSYQISRDLSQMDLNESE
jgi:tRNA threonylcarbamoyladenosine biosynthesis protein TsaE